LNPLLEQWLELLLAERSRREDAGSPLEQLTGILDGMRDRLLAAPDAPEISQNELARQCEAWLTDLGYLKASD
jgi:hypothetical protein